MAKIVSASKRTRPSVTEFVVKQTI
jgi:hypothetical protein